MNADRIRDLQRLLRKFMGAVNTRLRDMRSEIRNELLLELRETGAETRSAPVDVREGPPGEPGRGVAAVEVRDADLVVRYSDGAEQIAGRVAGEPGATAYEIARRAGFVGTEPEWLASLKGMDGDTPEPVPGERGASAYDVAVAAGFRGTEVEWLASLVPAVPEPVPGDDGASAYEIARRAGFVGTEPEWLASLRGADGRSVTIEDVRPLVSEEVRAAVEALPRPKDGEDGEDGASVTLDDVRPVIDAAVRAAVAEIPAPKDGEDGKSITVDDVRPIIGDEVRAAVEAIPPPKDGEDGRSVTADDVRPLVEAEVRAAVEALPKPKDGEDGEDGASVTLDDVRPLIEEGVRAAVDAFPVRPLVEEEVRAAVAALPTPKDGDDGASVTLDDVQPLIDAGVRDAVAALPKPKDGADGIATREEIEDLVQRGIVEYLTRGIEAVDARTIRVGEHEFRLPGFVFRDTWKSGTRYAVGDVAVWDGSSWHCNVADVTEKPGTGSGWTLMVKKGRKGADMRPAL